MMNLRLLLVTAATVSLTRILSGGCHPPKTRQYARLLHLFRGIKFRLPTRLAIGDGGRGFFGNQLGCTIGRMMLTRSRMKGEFAAWQQRLKAVETAMASINVGVLSLDLRGNVCFVNSIARSLLGADRQPVKIGGSIWRTVDVDSPLGAWLEDRLKTPTTNGSYNYVASFSDKSGGLPLRIDATSIQGETGVIRELVIVIRRSQALVGLPTPMLQMSEPADSTISRRAFAHDISNPLSTIKVFVELLPLKKDRPAFMDRFNRLVPREILRMEEMVSTLGRKGL